jgi:hypothetical protein
MKKIILIIVLLSAGTTFAQTEKGKVVFSGGTSLLFTNNTMKTIYDGNTTGTYTATGLSFLPAFSWFIVNNLGLGLLGNLSTTTYKDDSGNKDIVSSISIMPSLMYYFPVAGKVRPLVLAAIGGESDVDKYVPKSGSNDKTTYSGLT